MLGLDQLGGGGDRSGIGHVEADEPRVEALPGQCGGSRRAASGVPGPEQDRVPGPGEFPRGREPDALVRAGDQDDLLLGGGGHGPSLAAALHRRESTAEAGTGGPMVAAAATGSH